MSAAPDPRRAALSPWIYVRRNLRRVAPLLAIQALVTSLLVLIITPTNAFQATALANIRPLDTFTIVTPRLKRVFDDELFALLDANPAMERRVDAKMFWISTPMIVGESYAPIIAVRADVRDDFLAKVGSTLIEGAFPESGSDGVVLHEAVVRARGMALGQAFGRLVDKSDSTPGRFTLVGILAGEARMGVADFDYASQPLFVLARRDPFQVIYAESGNKRASDAYLHAAKDAEDEEAFRVVDADFVRTQLEQTMSNLPLVIGFITASVAIIVALVVSLLNVIAFQIRIDEFGLLLAVGHRRSRLVRKLVVETTIVAVSGWLVGLLVGLGGLWLYDHLALEPKGIVMRIVDPLPLLFSLSVPVFSTLTGAIALGRRLHRMDPVAVIQRRGA
jgi:hypothetical protein